MAKDALTVLREARELISDPKRWTQQEYARDEAGNGVWSNDPKAVCWCSIGAVRKVARDKGLCEMEIVGGPIGRLSEAAFDLYGRTYVAGVNDGSSHSVILRMFDAAIASAEKEAGNAVQA